MDVRLTNKENCDGTNGAPALYANIPIMNIKDEVRQTAQVQQSPSTDESKKETKRAKQTEKNKVERTKKDEKTEKVQKLKKALEFEYGFKELSQIPSKDSVSHIVEGKKEIKTEIEQITKNFVWLIRKFYFHIPTSISRNESLKHAALQ